MGNYTAPPARRWRYDGEAPTIFVWQDNVAGVTTHGQAELDKLNDEDDDDVIINAVGNLGTTDTAYIGFILGDNGQLTNAFIVIETNGSNNDPTVNVQYSDDTTDGRDGTWVTQESAIVHLFFKSVVSQASTRPAYRTTIAAISGATARKAWRFQISFTTGFVITNGLRARVIHLYGPERGPANSISFRLVASDTEIATDLDFEDMARAVTPVKKTFRVKNLGATQANNVTLTVGAGQSHDGGSAVYTEISDDDITYGSSVNIGSLATGALSGTLFLRSSPGVAAELSVKAARITVVATWV